jgi:hypothetical protein
VPFIIEARLLGPCPPLPHPPRLQGRFGLFVSLNWLNSKMVGLFVGCAILYVGSPLHGIHDALKPLAARFEWASFEWRGKATFGGALLSFLVRAAADIRYLWSSFR